MQQPRNCHGHHPVVACTIGIAALVSVAVKKPLALALFRSLKSGDPGRFNKPSVRRKFTLATAVFGIVFLIDGIIHVGMALVLSTSVFFIASRIVTLGMLVILVLAVRHILWFKKFPEGEGGLQ